MREPGLKALSCSVLCLKFYTPVSKGFVKYSNLLIQRDFRILLLILVNNVIKLMTIFTQKLIKQHTNPNTPETHTKT